MTHEEMQARIEKLESELAAVLRVLWAMRNEQKGMTAKLDTEIKQYIGNGSGKTNAEELFKVVTYTPMPKT